ncbi:MAG: class II fumarate hydratase [Candidatus Heimdallarchaeaceae archaeon]
MISNEDFRIEKDVLGELKVPKEAYWGISTQRALKYFRISGKCFPDIFITSLALVKKACALANLDLQLIKEKLGRAIIKAADEIINEKKLLEHNMNMNEVLANRANEMLGFQKGKKEPIHPNDHVNKCQSSNDVIPTAMHLSTLKLLDSKLFPAIKYLKDSLDQKINEFNDIVKVGRTHLQDAVPIPLSLEFKVYKKQLEINEKRLKAAREELCYIPLGGTALGTGLNAHEKFPEMSLSHLVKLTGIEFKSNPIKAESIASHNIIVNCGKTLHLLALSLLKMANDIRLMGSGPRAGLGELILPQNEPGSSIMPGKINPTQSEMLIQVCLHVIGNVNAISLGELQGSILDLNTCKPMMIVNLLESIELLSNAIKSFSEYCLIGIKANEERINQELNQLLMVVTNLTPIIGYDKCAEIAQKAHEEGKTIKQVIKEMNLKFEKDIDDLLDPKKMI